MKLFSFVLLQISTDFLSMIPATVKALNALLHPKIKMVYICARSMGLLVCRTISSHTLCLVSDNPNYSNPQVAANVSDGRNS